MQWPYACFAPIVVLAFTGVGSAQSPARYVGRLADGQMISGAVIADWHSPDANPRLDNQPLLDPNNSFRWLRDRALRLSDEPNAYVETWTGDRVPGEVVEFVGADSNSFAKTPPHFIVEPTAELNPPRPHFPKHVRVMVDAVRRIVWRKRSVNRWEPNVAFFQDGRAIKFRGIRFSGKSVFLLLEEGQTEASLADLAELHFPERDPWDAYFDELALLTPSGESRLLQCETTDGLIVTTSRDRLFPLAEGGPSDSQRWLHGLHPAWSLDMIWIPHRNVVVRRAFAPNEVPLSRLFPQSEKSPSSLNGVQGQAKVNRNVEGGALESGGQAYGWGFGVLGASQLRFPIPAMATAVQGRVGLDRIAGSGGSIQASIFLDKTEGAPLWQSAPLVGASQTTDWGNLSLPGDTNEHRELILKIDPLLHNAPPGADPLDIRDLADWLDPLLLLDSQRLQGELSRRTPRRVYAWRDWEVDTEVPYKWRQQFDLNGPASGVRLGVIAPDQPFRATRRLPSPLKAEWLVVQAEHLPNASQRAKLEVRIQGEAITEWEIPSYASDPARRQILVVPLHRLANSPKGNLLLELVQMPNSPEASVFWEAATFVSEPPTLFPLFEDEGDFAAVEGSRPETLSFESGQRHSGRNAMRIMADNRFSLRAPQPLPVRERPAIGEFRFLRFAFRKSGGGRVAVELHREQEGAPPIRYDAGIGEPAYGSAVRGWSLELPQQWIVITRDLYKDFGKADITGLTLGVPDGDYALFDHIYLARSEADLDLLPSASTVEGTNQEARRELAKSVLEKVVPATVAVDFGNRFSTGVIVSQDGDILTAGHAVVGPGKEVTVRLADGRRLKAKTAGVARELDLGLVRIEESGEWPAVPLGDGRNLPQDQLYVGVAHRRSLQTEAAPAAHIVGIERTLQGVIWTDFDVDDWCAGGPLCDKDGRLVGVQRGRSQLGGFLYTQLVDIHSALGRLRNGDVWGEWAYGCGPMMGVHVESVPGGCRVAEVYPETPAADAGLRVGDWITKIDGRQVRRLDDIYDRLGATDPGQQVALEVRRGSEMVSATIALIPRTP